MSNRLGGKQGTAYLGTNANQPPNWTFSDRDPNQYDVNNVSLGDMWLNQVDESAWILVSLAGDAQSKGSIATWVSLANDGTGAISTLTGNTGGLVTGDGNANIDFVGDGIGITITGNPGTHTLTASLVGGGVAAQSFDTDDGTAVPVAGVINIIADTASVNAGSSVSFSGTGNTVTLNVTDSNDNTIIGRNSGSGVIAGGDNTILGEASGVSLTSGSDNTIIGGTAGAAISSGSNNIIIGSTAGSALATSDSLNTIIGGTGFVGASDFIVVTAGAAGVPMIHNYPGTNASTTNGGNTFLGANAGNFTLAGGAGNASNNGIGTATLTSLTTGARNNAMGSLALTEMTTGVNNIAIGHNAADSLLTGASNVIIGNAAGSAYIGAESSNILLGSVAGTAAESNVLRIGSDTGTGTGELNQSFIAGIRGITPAVNDGIPVFISSTGQLGTVGTGGTTFVQTLTGDGAVVVSPLAGNINIVGDGSTAAVTANPGTQTLTISAIGGGGGTLNDLVGDDAVPVVPLAGIINVITGNATQDAGATVLFSGSIANTLKLLVSDLGDNTIMGLSAGNATLTGTNNTTLGVSTLNALTTGSDNVCVGGSSGLLVTTGSDNILLGAGAGEALITGSNNILVGTTAGSSYVNNENSNILFNSIGTATESNALRIGAATGTGTGQLNKAFISGIRGITPATADGIPVFIGSAGQLGTVGNGGTTMVQTITGNAGGAVGPAAGNINIVGDGVTVQITGNPGTNTLTVVGLGGGGGDLSILTGDVGLATAAAGTINVITNLAGVDAGSSVLFSGTSNTLTLSVTDNSDNTLIGAGSGNLTLTGTNNTALGVDCGSAITTGSNNIFIGIDAGTLVTTGNGNFLCGNGNLLAALQGTTTSTGLYAFGASTGRAFLHNFGGEASGNTFVGYGAGSFNAGQVGPLLNNTACGSDALGSLTIGSSNTALGVGAGFGILTGSNNVFLGEDAGRDYTNNESHNIMINNLGVVGESHALRIGDGTGTGTAQLNKTFIHGIRGITTGISNAIPVVIDSAGQLGTAGGGSVVTSLTANTGGPVSATGGNINVVGDGTTITIAGNPGTSTLTVSALGTGTAFFAYLTNQISIPGPQILTTVIYDTLGFNLGAAFDLGTSTFTAPVDGFYNFSFGLALQGGAANDFYAVLETTSQTFVVSVSNATNIRATSASFTNGKIVVLGNTVYTTMDAGDTAIMRVWRVASGGSFPLAGIAPFPTGIGNFFSGSLVT